MSSAQKVTQYLPYLRRYARALTGSQASADAYVAATMEAMIGEPGIVQTDNPKMALFRLFTAIWNSLPLNKAMGTVEPDTPAEQRLGRLTPRARQAFLLVSLEDFSERDAANILDVTLGELRSLTEDAGRELASEIATEVLIIEDESLIALDLEGLIESLGHRVIGIARTHSEALAIAKQRPPGLILADIQLADGSSGLDVVNELLDSFEVPVIFITAYPERFLTGQRPEPAFLISKPFQPANVAAVVSQALFFERKAVSRRNVA